MTRVDDVEQKLRMAAEAGIMCCPKCGNPARREQFCQPRRNDARYETIGWCMIFFTASILIFFSLAGGHCLNVEFLPVVVIVLFVALLTALPAIIHFAISRGWRIRCPECKYVVKKKMNKNAAENFLKTGLIG